MLYVATALCTVHKVFMKYSHIKKTIIFMPERSHH